MLYRIRIEIKNEEGVFQEVATMERKLPAGVGGKLLLALNNACEAIEKEAGLPGPEGGLSE